MAGSVKKPNVIIFGGCGFIGRNLVEYLVSNKFVSSVRVVDKVPPLTAWLNKKHQLIYSNPLVEFKSYNLILQDGAEKAFDGKTFDYAINCAGETKWGQTDKVYEDGVLKVSLNCANAAAKHGVKRYIEVSTEHLEGIEKVALKETDPVKAWSRVGKCKLTVEGQLKNVPNLKYTIIRPGLVYGPGDKTGLVSRLMLGYVYKRLGLVMRLLWSKDLIINTVHVMDLARSIWHLAKIPEAEGEIYHVVDDGKTTQGCIASIISDIFKIDCDFFGNLIFAIARVDLGVLAVYSNHKHMTPWVKSCQCGGVTTTPLNPYVHQEQLVKKHINLDNQKLKDTGFTFLYPKLTKEAVMEVIEDYSVMELFPPLSP